MITLTQPAVEKVKSIMAERREGGGLRIAVIGGGCSGFQYQMSLDQQAAVDDQVVEQDGLKLFVDSRSMLLLHGTKIDYVDGLSGSGFKFENPNSKGSCGCGESFQA
ncbi:MAG: iron-sulfur cluster assembly accessory protein [Acidobacteria bacterium]|nr:iron-sulfur cluster assembly accessory protein [Acidobacteriota bacterium]